MIIVYRNYKIIIRRLEKMRAEYYRKFRKQIEGIAKWTDESEEFLIRNGIEKQKATQAINNKRKKHNKQKEKVVGWENTYH